MHAWSLRVGHLVMATVVKAWPYEPAMLLLIQPDGPLALLPHAEADRPYKVGESLLAAVAAVIAPYPRLTQRGTHYVRRIVELVLSPLIDAQRLRVLRVATRASAPFCKVLLRLATPETLKEAITLLPECRAYVTPRVTLVPHDQDLARLALAALRPVRAEAVVLVKPDPGSRLVWVVAHPERWGGILGPRGANLAMAGALLRRQFRLCTPSDWMAREAALQRAGTRLNGTARRPESEALVFPVAAAQAREPLATPGPQTDSASG